MLNKVNKIVIRDTYKVYKESVKNPIDQKTYLQLTGLYNKFLVGKVLQGDTVTLPAKFGTLEVTGKKYKISVDEDGNIKGAGIDWVKTKALRERSEKAREEKSVVRYTNPHSSGITYKFFWSKQRVLIENKTLYSLVMTRTVTRALSKLIFGGREFAIRK